MLEILMPVIASGDVAPPPIVFIRITFCTTLLKRLFPVPAAAVVFCVSDEPAPLPSDVALRDAADVECGSCADVGFGGAVELSGLPKRSLTGVIGSGLVDKSIAPIPFPFVWPSALLSLVFSRTIESRLAPTATRVLTRDRPVPARCRCRPTCSPALSAARETKRGGTRKSHAIHEKNGHRFISVRSSARTSMSHFLPLWRLNVQRSKANHADTARRPKELNAVKIVVRAAVTGLLIQIKD